MIYKVTKRLFENLTEYKTGDLIELTDERAKQLNKYIEKNENIYNEMEESIYDGVKYKNKMIDKFKKKKK